MELDRLPIFKAQIKKCLKDRLDRTLGYEDINHYQHIIIALTETSRLMKEIDDLGLEW